MASLQILGVSFWQKLLLVQLMEETLADFAVGSVRADEYIPLEG